MKASLSPEARLAFLWQASQALSSSLDYETTLLTVARLMVPTLADWAALDLADEEGRLQRLAVVHVDPVRERWGWELSRRYPPDPAEPQGALRVFQSGEPLLIPELTPEMLAQSARDAEHLELLRELGLTSAVIVPLTARGRRLGTLSLVTAESGRHYGAEELTLAEEVAGRAALAVEHARLYLAESRARAEAEAAAARSATLLALTSALAGDLSAHEVAATSLARALPALGAWAGSFFLLSPDGSALELLHYQGYPEDLIERWRCIVLESGVPLADAARRADPVFLESRRDWSERYPHLESARARTDASAVVALPLISHGRPIGAMGLSFRGERDFTADDRKFLLILAGHCAQALDRALATAALQASEARFRSVFESGMVGIAFWNGERVTDANDELLAILGYDRGDLAAGGLRHGVLTPPEYEAADARAYAECLQRRNCTPYEKEFFRKDGSRVPVLVGGSLLDGPKLGVFFVLDLTERRQVEAQMHASQRVEAIGRLAGGVAHEINNALQGVLGFAAFVRRATQPDDPRLRDIEEIERAGTRAAHITHQLLAFSRRQVRQPRHLDVRRVIGDFAPMLQQALGPERELVLEPGESPVLVHADRAQLEQVLLNLTLNARDATAPGDRLTLGVEPVAVGASALAAAQFGEEPEHPPPGAYVRIEARDTGVGMPPEVRDHVFEPFFTTKEPGKGTGLGLSVVYGIVRQSGGFITVESAPGEGSAFRIHLPAAAGGTDAGTPSPEAPPPGRGETVLVVDDEPNVLAVASRTLEESGYRVVTAINGREALELLARRPDVALVLSDVLMPVVGGEELARWMATERPGLPLLLTSGHPERGRGTAAGMLPKPFDPDDLLRAVRRALDAGRAAPSD